MVKRLPKTTDLLSEIKKTDLYKNLPNGKNKSKLKKWELLELINEFYTVDNNGFMKDKKKLDINSTREDILNMFLPTDISNIICKMAKDNKVYVSIQDEYHADFEVLGVFKYYDKAVRATIDYINSERAKGYVLYHHYEGNQYYPKLSISRYKELYDKGHIEFGGDHGYTYTITESEQNYKFISYDDDIYDEKYTKEQIRTAKKRMNR